MEHFVILTCFECFCHMRSELLANSWIVISSNYLFTKWKVLIFLIASMSLEVNFSFFSLLIIVHLLFWIKFSVIWILITSRVWSEECQILETIKFQKVGSEKYKINDKVWVVIIIQISSRNRVSRIWKR